MAIEITCECGKACRVSDDKSGQRFKCRECETLVRVPKANCDATDDDVDLGDDDSEVTRVRTTRSNASPKQSWLPIVIPIVIAVVAAVPAWSMFGVMLLEPRSFDEFIQGLLAGLGVFVAVGALPWFLYVNLIPKPASQEPEVDAPKFSAESLVWQTDDRKDRPVSVIVDRAAGMIHFQNCAIRVPFLLGWPLRWFSCSLSDLRSFHICYTKTGSNLVIKTDVGKVTVVHFDNSFPAIIQALDDAIPGGHRRFHEDHPLAILLFLLAGVSAAVLALFLIPDRLSPRTALTVVLGSGVAMTFAVRSGISFWSGRRRLMTNGVKDAADGSSSLVEGAALSRFGQTLGLIVYLVGVVLAAAFFCFFGGHAILTQHMAVKNGAPVTGIAALLVGSLFVALGVGLLIVMVRLLWKWCRR